MYNPFDDYKTILEWMEHKEGDTFQHSKDEFVQALRRYADWFETLENQVISVNPLLYQFCVDTASNALSRAKQRTVVWVLGSPERSPLSLDVVIADVE